MTLTRSDGHFAPKTRNNTVAWILPPNFKAKKGTLLVTALLFYSSLFLISFESVPLTGSALLLQCCRALPDKQEEAGEAK